MNASVLQSAMPGADGWSQYRPAFTKTISDVLLSDDFKSSMKAMIEEYESTPPDMITDSGFEFVSLKKCRQLFDKYFGFMTLTVQTTFVTGYSDEDPICQKTLMVLTDKGEEPWFSRLGMGDLSRVSTDGIFIDAENSALRRLFAAIGMGYDDHTDFDIKLSKALIEKIDNKIKSAKLGKLSDLLKSYRATYSGQSREIGLSALSFDKQKDNEVSIENLSKTDANNLLSFMSVVYPDAK